MTILETIHESHRHRFTEEQLSPIAAQLAEIRARVRAEPVTAALVAEAREVLACSWGGPRVITEASEIVRVWDEQHPATSS